MNQLALSLAGAVLASSVAAAQDATTGNVVPFNARTTTYIGVYDAVTGVLTPAPAGASRGVGGLGEAVYNNTAPTGFLYDIDDGSIIIDEGRIPSTSSPDLVGTQDSYTISSLQIGYATDSTDATGLDVQLALFERFAACGLPATTDAPHIVIDLTGLPASTGGIASFLFDVDLSGLGVCLRGDGNGVYTNGTGDRFGWSIQFTNAGNGTLTGPLISGDPLNVPEGDGTVFQNPGGAGSGLTTGDLFRQLNPDGTANCFFFGGYPANVFASFYMVVRSDLSGDCIGCGIGDDRFEPNDSLAEAAPIAIDSYSGLIQEVADDNDYYSFTLPANSEIIGQIFFDNAISDLDLILYDSTDTIVDTGFTVTDDERVSFANCTGVDEAMTIRVNNFGNICNEYDMVLSLNPLFADDALEDNDECGTAIPIPLGASNGLIVRPCGGTGGADDGDYYSLNLADGESITVDILFADDLADIDLVIYDTSAGCPGSVVASGFSTTDNENASYTNSSGSAQSIVVRVDHFSGESAAYDMRVKVGDPTLGELVCIGVDNSTGSNGELCATGSDVAADNDVTLAVTSLPTNALGYFVVSQDTIFLPNPGGSTGNLCIGSVAIGRYATNVLDSGATGEVSFSPDLTVIPIAGGGGTGTIPAMPGDTFCFQLWHRDNDGMGMPTSNFSDAICITFN